MKKILQVGTLMLSLGFLATASSAFAATNIMFGSRGEEVANMQGYLQERGYLIIPNGVGPGYFGNLTRNALMRFQSSVGLSSTGAYDDDTEFKLTGKNNSGGSTKNGQPMTDTKAAGLRVLLNSINREHANLASVALRKGYDGATDFDASFKALDNNSVEIANSITSVYGSDAGAKFLEIWRSHITYFKNYTVASKNKDQAGKDKAVQDLASYVDNISTFLSQANPNLPFNAVHSLVSTHVSLLKDTIDRYFMGDLTGSYSQQHATDIQIGTGVADAVAGAIVKQFPEKF